MNISIIEMFMRPNEKKLQKSKTLEVPNLLSGEYRSRTDDLLTARKVILNNF
nr:hypothetical protein [uncultured bacterium]